MITFKHYKRLSVEKQAQILWKDGVFLDLARETSNRNVDLYALEDFYVEIYYNKRNAEPMSLKPFQQMKKLDPYLNLINIRNVVERPNNGMPT